VKRRKRTCRRVPGECRGTLRHGLRHERRRRATDACARVDARRTAPIAGTLGVWCIPCIVAWRRRRAGGHTRQRSVPNIRPRSTV
jgi:hypothetical protein